MYIFPTLKNYKKENLKGDITAGIIVSAVSIPIAMGYAQIAGLPAVYGLFGSVLPIVFFALISTSPQMIWGVDAAPAALVGGILASSGIAAESPEAMNTVPALALFTGIWLLILSLARAGKMVKYISEAVMGGFISGIAVHVILMQIPKLLGGTAGTGEILELLKHNLDTLEQVHWPSILLGVGTLTVILVSKKLLPKFPMAVFVMILGALSTYLFHINRFGIATLPAVDGGLPSFMMPEFNLTEAVSYLKLSLPIAVVILAETLLASKNFAVRNGDKLNENREIFAYGIGNVMASITGCCPVNGSVSRTVMSAQFGGKTQLTGIVAGVVMVGLLLFGTGFIGYLPVPVLTAIVISALIGVFELDLAKKLFKVDKTEFKIFAAAFIGVLVLGTIYGVVIGVLLSFLDVLIGAVAPPKDFMGVIPGHKGYYSLTRNPNAKPIEHVVIYRFSGNLFFANIDVFCEDIENAITDETRVFIVDGRGITNIDMTAAERILELYEKLSEEDIHFYLTEHIGKINDRLRKFGCDDLLRHGAVKQVIDLALSDAGIYRPYKLEGTPKLRSLFKAPHSQTFNEFQWLFGDRYMEEMERHVSEILKNANPADTIDHALEAALHGDSEWDYLDRLQEDDIMEALSFHIKELAREFGVSEEALRRGISGRRSHIANLLKEEQPDLFGVLQQHREDLDRRLKRLHETRMNRKGK